MATATSPSVRASIRILGRRGLWTGTGCCVQASLPIVQWSSSNAWAVGAVIWQFGEDIISGHTPIANRFQQVRLLRW